MAEFNIKDIVKPENLAYSKSKILTDNVMHYCPGCGHGTAHRVLAEVIEEEDLQSKTVGISPVGCSVLMYNYLDVDMQEAAHGRAPALATAVKRLMPDKFVFTYQGDGDLAAIGTAETIHTCNRGEDILIIFINNGDIRHDWRTDGPHNPAGHEVIHLTLRTRKDNDGFAHKDG